MDADQSAALEVHTKGQSTSTPHPHTPTDSPTARAEVSLDPLAWDATLADYAQKYANKLAKKDKGMHHCEDLPNLNQGENLCCSPGGGTLSYETSSKCWYAEIKDWNGGAIQAYESGFQATGHYTQVSNDDCRYATAAC